MKNVILSICALCSITSNAQNEPNTQTYISFADTFQFTFGFANLAANESMMGDAHQEAFPLITGRLGIFNYNRFSLGLHGSVHRMSIKDIQYFGNFSKTTAYTIGPYLSYYIPVSAEGLIEPYVSYDYTDYTSKGFGKKLDSESDGLGLGIDYQHKVGGKAYMTIGLKYHMNTMRTSTHPNWEKYMNNYNYLSAKVGFTFSNNRL